MILPQNRRSLYASRLALACALGGATVAPSCANDEARPPVTLGGVGASEAADVPASGAALDDAFGERHNPSIAFAPCAGAPAFECGTLEVPADYDEPGGAKLGLAVLRVPATGQRIGTLFTNFGGPAGFQTDTLAALVTRGLAPLREHFDLIAFDPRGTPSSEPETRCDFAPPPPPAPGDPAARAQYLDEHARRFAEACLAQTGPVVAKLGTNNVARDIDLLRAALGEKTISYYGISYGAELGAVYASLFPKRVRAALLDGGTSDVFADYTVQAYAEQAAATELALARLDQLCRADAACPLHDVGLSAGVAQLLAALRANPVASDDGTVLLDEGAAARVVY
ncbi:MAG TPA: alpha/beta hydrolase, partial [Polyangiaceae bacterium]|nr:alpha/beta hydrolase [Polyangiaceae bacterium]